MVTNSTSLEKQVDQLFAALNAKHGDCCRNPVTGVGFVWGLDPITLQKTEAVRALRARAGFAANAPSDAPPLPLSHDDIEDYRNAGGLAALVGFYGRSLSSSLLKNREMEGFLFLDDGCCGGAVELDVIFEPGAGGTLTRGG
jgi:hypothetical protein